MNSHRRFEMTFNSDICRPDAANQQVSNCALKKTRKQLIGFIGVFLAVIGFLNMTQSIRANDKSSQLAQEKCCGCGRDCLCGNGCGCSKVI